MIPTRIKSDVLRPFCHGPVEPYMHQVRLIGEHGHCSIVMAGLDPAIYTSTLPREMAGSVAGHDVKIPSSGLNLMPMRLDRAMTVKQGPVNLFADLCDSFRTRVPSSSLTRS